MLSTAMNLVSKPLVVIKRKLCEFRSQVEEARLATRNPVKAAVLAVLRELFQLFVLLLEGLNLEALQPLSPLPKFLVTTVAADSCERDKDGNPLGRYEFTSTSDQAWRGAPVFLVDLAARGNGKYTGRAVTPSMFAEALASTGEDVLFFVHGYMVQTKAMFKYTHEMQREFDELEPQRPVRVVPIDWACNDKPLWNPLFGSVKTYYEDQASSEEAGRILGTFLRGLKLKDGQKLNLVAHSMGNRVLRTMGKVAVPDGACWDMDALQGGSSLLDAAPEGLKIDEHLFDNLFFVAADIPATVFDAPADGKEDEQFEHALKSGIAALSVMTRRMHVLHASFTDMALNASFALNEASRRLGSNGPNKVWSLLEKKVQIVNCGAWNNLGDPVLGHNYATYKKAVEYYLEQLAMEAPAMVAVRADTAAMKEEAREEAREEAEKAAARAEASRSAATMAAAAMAAVAVAVAAKAAARAATMARAV